MQRLFAFLFVLVTFSHPDAMATEENELIKEIVDDQIVVQFKVPQKTAADEVLSLYNDIRDDLEKTLQWRADFVPVIRLVGGKDEFYRITGNHSIVAVAYPEQYLIIIDCSKMRSPFSINTTLKHELCHLMLHHNVAGSHMPRWLDEGICQWLSGGISEIWVDTGKTNLERAILSNTLLSLDRLTRTFPDDPESLTLAYQQSKGFIEYLNNQYGSSRLFMLLHRLKEVDNVEDAFVKVYAASLYELEQKWQSNIRRRTDWVAYISNNIYEILFLSAGLLTIFGFIRMLIRIKRYREDDEDEDEENMPEDQLQEKDNS